MTGGKLYIGVGAAKKPGGGGPVGGARFSPDAELDVGVALVGVTGVPAPFLAALA